MISSRDILEVLLPLVDAIKSDDPLAYAEARKRVSSLRGASGRQTKTSSRSSSVDRVNIDRLYDLLMQADTRESGAELLSTERPNKNALVAIARLGKVHVTKSDSVVKLEEKLIESLIGSRLSSAAIRREST